MTNPAQARLVAQARMLNARSGAVAQRMLANGQSGGVVQRAIRAGADSRSPAEWRALLDPDGANAALAAALEALDGQEFASEAALREAIAGQNPMLQGEEEPVLSQEPEQTFGTMENALAYLAARTGFALDDIEDFESMEPEWFEGLPDMTRAEVDADDWPKQLLNLRYMHKQYLTNLPKGGGGGKGDWATKTIRNAAKNTVKSAADGALFPGDAYTVHHKVSRSKLLGLYGQMEKAPVEHTAALRATVANIGLQAGITSQVKALLNIPGNLEVGPQSRISDPGANFDPNVRDGSYTPRSRVLWDVDTEIGKPAIDFDRVAMLLEEVQRQHQLALGMSPGPLTAPLKTQWSKDKGGAFKRDM